jgi:uncharacterized protein YecT (DUF1311 family)
LSAAVRNDSKRNRGSILTAAGVLLALIGVMALGWCSTAVAAEQGTSCAEATTTAAMRACENTRFQKADREMKAAYGALERGLTGKRRASLRTAQNAWLRFRDANVAYYRGEAEGGTLAPLIGISALADMTEARGTELRKARERP